MMAISTQKTSIFEKRVVNRKVVNSQKYVKYMVSKNILKQLGQLGQKKHRTQLGLFSVEGAKAITTFLENGFLLKYYFGTSEVVSKSTDNITEATVLELKKLSNLSTAPSCWAAFHLPKQVDFSPESLNLALDGIRDPGNLGTIIRLCDWFGIAHLLCSKDTVDCFNPKVVQASMGSLAKVQVHYVDLPEFFKQQNLAVVCTDVKGERIYKASLPQNPVLVVGNESKGISQAVRHISEMDICIPSYGATAAESLNAAMAAAIVLSEFRRRA
jgi:TrmH family RNA methyltransferase